MLPIDDYNPNVFNCVDLTNFIGTPIPINKEILFKYNITDKIQVRFKYNITECIIINFVKISFNSIYDIFVYGVEVIIPHTTFKTICLLIDNVWYAVNDLKYDKIFKIKE